MDQMKEIRDESMMRYPCLGTAHDGFSRSIHAVCCRGPRMHCLLRHIVIMVLYIYTTPHSKAHHHGSYTSIKERTSYGPDLKHGRHAQSEDMKN